MAHAASEALPVLTFATRAAISNWHLSAPVISLNACALSMPMRHEEKLRRLSSTG